MLIINTNGAYIINLCKISYKFQSCFHFQIRNFLSLRGSLDTEPINLILNCQKSPHLRDVIVIQISLYKDFSNYTYNFHFGSNSQISLTYIFLLLLRFHQFQNFQSLCQISTFLCTVCTHILPCNDYRNICFLQLFHFHNSSNKNAQDKLPHFYRFLDCYKKLNRSGCKNHSIAFRMELFSHNVCISQDYVRNQIQLVRSLYETCLYHFQL